NDSGNSGVRPDPELEVKGESVTGSSSSQRTTVTQCPEWRYDGTVSMQVNRNYGHEERSQSVSWRPLRKPSEHRSQCQQFRAERSGKASSSRTLESVWRQYWWTYQARQGV